MARAQGLSGLAAILAVSGGVLVASALRNEKPLDYLRVVIGRPTSGAVISKPISQVTSGVRSLAIGGTVPGATNGGRADALIAEARRHLGKRYVWGATGPDTFDCSGLVVFVLRRTGTGSVPRFTTYSFGSWAAGRGATRVKPADFRAGDIIVRTGHMAIATTAETMIHAPNVTTVVKEERIYSKNAWWGWRLGAPATMTEI